MEDWQFERSVEMIENATNILVLTGAGMSTESGIPDFRSKGGIYDGEANKEEIPPETILSRNFFFKKPDVFYDFLKKKLIFPYIKPNKGHEILAKWEKEGIVSQIITQNIDGLHQEAGSESVIEFHGTIKTATCYNPKCRKKYDLFELVNKEGKFYYCKECGEKEEGTRRLIKPDVVLFGDVGGYFSSSKFGEIYDMAADADLMIVLGTSLSVYPFRDIPTFLRRGIPMIIINYGTTPFDKRANTIVINESIGETLKKIDEALK